MKLDVPEGVEVLEFFSEVTCNYQTTTLSMFLDALRQSEILSRSDN